MDARRLLRACCFLALWRLGLKFREPQVHSERRPHLSGLVRQKVIEFNFAGRRGKIKDTAEDLDRATSEAQERRNQGHAPAHVSSS
jgi:hypothetical protein